MRQDFSYQQTEKFTSLVNDYLANTESLHSFYNRYPLLENFPEQWKEKSNQNVDRKILVDVLQKQNEFLSLSSLTKENIAVLAEQNTFTITTGHQLCLFTGPLYFIYKIVSALNLVEELKRTYPQNNFVPIFWMASEDHDFQEVNHINLFGKTLRWQTEQKGAVGRMSLEGLGVVLDELDVILGEGDNASFLSALFREAYSKHTSLSDASRFIINALFGKYGLVIIDGDDFRLKKQFLPIIKKDILEKGFVDAISSCSKELAKEYKAQAFVRDVNFFRLSEGKRERIEVDVSESEIEEKPESFSPNVLLRPLYQETILPNIAYIGGGAEVAYWMQLKTAFDQESMPFPILILRNSCLWLEQKQVDKWQNLEFNFSDFFIDEHQLQKQYVNKKTDLDLSDEMSALKKIFTDILVKASGTGMQSSILAEQKKQIDAFDKLEKKLLKNEKKKHQQSLHQISQLKTKLFPNNGLQERHDNFIPFYLKYGENFIEILLKELKPLDVKFVILSPQ